MRTRTKLPESGVVPTRIAAVILLWAPAAAVAHTPLQVPMPQSVPEAWDVVRQSAANVAEVVATNQLREVEPHVRNIGIGVRTIWDDARNARNDDALAREVDRIFDAATRAATAAGAGDVEEAAAAARALSGQVAAVAAKYPPAVADAAVYTCPMHPKEIALDEAARCRLCNMRLIVRRIAASATYTRPGEGTVRMTLATDGPLTVDEPAAVTVTLTDARDRPVTEQDLLVMHTRPIHLLIVDRGLTDYHHEHPEPVADAPGRYRFTFTPRRPGPYRVFADVVPTSTGVQEYARADLPADTAPVPITDREPTAVATVGGLRFALGQDGPLRANHPTPMTLTVATANTGAPFARLEPTMGAFAHLVGFHEDGATVVHVHPLGREPDRATERGGPTLSFNFYPPAAGLIRLYAQVQVDGRQVFAPFTLTVTP